MGLNAYQWLVLAAGWAGWGCDVFDAVLFNFVAPACIASLLHLPAGSAAARTAAAYWNGTLTAMLLVGWAAGGVLFGQVADRIGRKRALMATISLYALGTGLCALVTSIGQLAACRALASLGIGGEWAIGAVLLAESVPHERRVQAAVIMQSSSPLAILLATAVNYQITGVWFADQPQVSWRYLFLCGLLPVALALGVRQFLRESDEWRGAAVGSRPARLRELFAPALRPATVGGLFAAATALLTWWGCNAFIPLLGSTLAAEHAALLRLAPAQAHSLAAVWQARAANCFNIGGLLGALAAILLARCMGRRAMFMCYFLWSALALWATFAPPLPPQLRLAMLFVVGMGVYGIMSSFTFYLPELFPTRLRASGAGLCYNGGRVLAAVGPFAVGALAAAAGGSSAALMRMMCVLALAPLLAALASPWLLVETQPGAMHPARQQAPGSP
ncbi:MAG: MFS transporter [Proteobacteria bacterium]|nr:MFS transporter [Pseudomonadota bacterium]